MEAPEKARTLGILSGEGELPLSIAREARAQGYRVVVLAMNGLTDPAVEKYADDVGWFKSGRFGAAVKYMKQHDVKQAVAAGKFPKSMLYSGALIPDLKLVKLLFKLKDRGDDSIINAIARELASDGIKLLDMRDFCRMLMTPEGPLTRNRPTDDEWEDIAYGFRAAKEIGRLEIGQTIVVKNLAVMAVEAIEGTDEAILRGGRLANGGATVVKVSRPEQDMRFDVPVVGSRTFECMKEAGVRVLALEAGSSIFLNKEEFLGEADAANIAVVGVTEEGLASRPSPEDI